MLICIQIEILFGQFGGEPLCKSILFIWGMSLADKILSRFVPNKPQSPTNAYLCGKKGSVAARVG